MYLENKQIITAEGMELQLNCESAATRRYRTNYYFDCSKCARQSIGERTLDTGDKLLQLMQQYISEKITDKKQP